jgi:hypothetical protein
MMSRESSPGTTPARLAEDRALLDLPLPSPRDVSDVERGADDSLERSRLTSETGMQLPVAKDQ